MKLLAALCCVFLISCTIERYYERLYREEWELVKKVYMTTSDGPMWHLEWKNVGSGRIVPEDLRYNPPDTVGSRMKGFYRIMK
jgi:hypothetical protein